jgi:hypothetical protein
MPDEMIAEAAPAIETRLAKRRAERDELEHQVRRDEGWLKRRK